MDTKPVKTIYVRAMYVLVVLAVVLSMTTIVYAASPSPFIGKWEATDLDESNISLTIAGGPSGPFQITWIDSHMSFCNGEAGIIRGTGFLNKNDANLLEADLHVKCFTTGTTTDVHLTLRRHPATDTLSARYGNGKIMLWHRPGISPGFPALNLRVNYGHDWVESFYESGHTAWVTVTESDGVTVKAIAELITEPKEYWGWEGGFQTLDSVWFDVEMNQLEYPPNIQPGDWVYGWVDNGAIAQVQIGEINGWIDLADDSIAGTISASWITDAVPVECFDWGSGGEPINKDAGFVLPDGADTYACSWAGQWDIQPWQTIGVGYFTPDGHWVANAFDAPGPYIVASEAGDWFWTTNFYPDLLDIAIYESADENAALLWSGQQATDPSGFVFVDYGIHGQDLIPGNYLVVSDGVNEKGLVLDTVTIEVFDTEHEIMSGKAHLGSDVWAAAGPQEWQERIMTYADPVSGDWYVDFTTVGFDITEEMRPWSYAHVYDEDGDANEGNTPPPPPNATMTAWLEWNVVEGFGWAIGDTVTLSIGDFSREALVVPSDWDPYFGYVRFELGEEHDLEAGENVVMTDGSTFKELLIPSLAVTWYDLGPKTITGTYDASYGFWVNVNGMEPDLAFDGSTWTATFGELGPDMWGDAAQIDEDGDEARATIHTPNPNLYALTEENEVIAQVWNIGVQLDLKIYNAAAEEVYSDFAIVQPPSEAPWTVVVFDLGAAGFDLLPAHRIVLNQNGYERELTVSSLQVTGFNYDEAKVIGIGDPGTNIFIRINGTDIWGEVNEFGNWEISHPQLAPGVWGEAIEPDNMDGDETRDRFQAH